MEKLAEYIMSIVKLNKSNEESHNKESHKEEPHNEESHNEESHKEEFVIFKNIIINK